MKLLTAIVLTGIMMFLGVIAWSGYMLWDIYSQRAHSRAVYDQMLAYSPLVVASHTANPEPVSHRPVWGGYVNPSIANLQASYDSAVGWLSISNTTLSHPFVQGQDNSFYLHRDINHQQSSAGTIFMDYRNCQDFSDFHTLIYGHNMNDGSMFAPLAGFSNRDFFTVNQQGHIFLPHTTYLVEWFAFAIIAPDDPVVYWPQIETLEERWYFLRYMKRIGLHVCQEVSVTPQDRVVTLSTCRNDRANSRMVLVGVLREL